MLGVLGNFFGIFVFLGVGFLLFMLGVIFFEERVF